MTDCTCQYDREREAYVHVCTFHAPAITLERDAEQPGDRFTLAGRDVTHDAAVDHAPIRDLMDRALAPTPAMVLGRGMGKTYAAGSAEHVRSLGQSLDAVRAAKRATWEASAENPAPTNRAERRRRGERGTYLTSLDNLTVRRRRR